MAGLKQDYGECEHVYVECEQGYVECEQGYVEGERGYAEGELGYVGCERGHVKSERADVVSKPIFARGDRGDVETEPADMKSEQQRVGRGRINLSGCSNTTYLRGGFAAKTIRAAFAGSVSFTPDFSQVSRNAENGRKPFKRFLVSTDTLGHPAKAVCE